LQKAEGYNLTLEEAQAYLAEMDDFELDSQQLKAVAGGGWCVIVGDPCDDYVHPNCFDECPRAGFDN